MKNSNRSLRYIGMGFGILTSFLAHAATTGSIQISGTVAATTAITVSSVAGYNNLNLAATATDLQVASVREINNTPTGYKVTLTSSNAGSLKNGSIDSLAYTAKYDGSAVTLSSSGTLITNVTSASAIVNVLKTFTISYTGKAADEMMQGTYSDTLTFTIAAN